MTNQAEEAVIGGLLLDSDLLSDIEWLRAEMFQTPFYGKVWELMTELKTFDVITLCESSEEMAGNMPLLTDLASNCASIVNFEHYAQIIRDKYLTRTAQNKLIEVCQKHANGYDYQAMLADAEQVLSTAEVCNESEESFNSIIKNALDGIEERFKSEGAVCGLSSGLRDLDSLVGGFGAGHLVIVAGRPKMGKTTFAINTICNTIKTDAGVVVFFSLEMSEDEIMQKKLSNLGGINSTKIRSGKLVDDDWQKLTKAIAQLKDKPVHLIAKAGIQLSELRARTKKIARTEKIALVVVDYLQLVRVAGAKSTFDEVSEVARQLKELAGDVQAPVMALSQLNRSLENRPDKRPVPSDLRSSGEIEQAADAMLFPYRDEVYNEDTDDKGIAEIGVIARHSPGGRVRVIADLAHTAFRDLDHNHMQG